MLYYKLGELIPKLKTRVNQPTTEVPEEEKQTTEGSNSPSPQGKGKDKKKKKKK